MFADCATRDIPVRRRRAGLIIRLVVIRRSSSNRRRSIAPVRAGNSPLASLAAFLLFRLCAHGGLLQSGERRKDGACENRCARTELIRSLSGNPRCQPHDYGRADVPRSAQRTSTQPARPGRRGVRRSLQIQSAQSTQRARRPTSRCMACLSSCERSACAMPNRAFTRGACSPASRSPWKTW